VVFDLANDEGERDAQKRITTYTFSKKGGVRLLYRPGESLWAEVPVKKEGEAGDWLLTWARNRSQVYQFERLARPPRLHRKGEKNTEGLLLDDVFLTVKEPGGGVPKIPALIPVVNLK